MKTNCTDFTATSKFLSVFSPSKLWENSRCIITVSHCVHCAKGKKRQMQLTYHLLPFITGIKTDMFLIIFLGLIAKLALVSDACDVGTRDVKNFNFTKVGISVLGCFLKQVAMRFFIPVVFYETTNIDCLLV